MARIKATSGKKVKKPSKKGIIPKSKSKSKGQKNATLRVSRGNGQPKRGRS